MLFYTSAALTFTSLFLIAVRPKQGILFLLVVKPIIDTTWNQSFFGVRLTYIMGVGVPLLILLRIMEERPSRIPLMELWLFFIILNFISVQLIIVNNYIEGWNIFFRVLNGFLGYYWFQRYFRERKDFKKLLVALLLAGIFPIGIGIFQFVTGHVWFIRASEGGYRNVGLYHDQATLKYYIFQTITAIFLYWVYFVEKSKYQYYLLTAYFSCCMIDLYKLYVKSGYAVFAVWVLIWTACQRRFILLAVFIIAFGTLNFAIGDRLTRDVANVYYKEISALRGELPFERSFAGRWYDWKYYLSQWQDLDLTEKFLGSGKGGYGKHNDYLFALSRSGIYGLSVYILLLVAIGFALLSGLSKGITPMRVMALMIFSMWLIETIGLVPSGYPSFQWFAWGFIGLSLRIDREGISFAVQRDKTERPPLRLPEYDYLRGSGVF